jgi:hypothetical protein
MKNIHSIGVYNWRGRRVLIKVKVKLSLGLTKYYVMKTYGGVDL